MFDILEKDKNKQSEMYEKYLDESRRLHAEEGLQFFKMKFGDLINPNIFSILFGEMISVFIYDEKAEFGYRSEHTDAVHFFKIPPSKQLFSETEEFAFQDLIESWCFNENQIDFFEYVNLFRRNHFFYEYLKKDQTIELLEEKYENATQSISSLLEDIIFIGQGEADLIIEGILFTVKNELLALPSQLDDEAGSLLEAYSNHIREGSMLSEMAIEDVMSRIWDAIDSLPVHRKQLLFLAFTDAESLDYYGDNVIGLDVVKDLEHLSQRDIRNWAFKILNLG